MPEKRSYYEKLASAHGYTPVSDANSSLGLLVAADPGESSSKLKNARKFGTRILSLEEFLKEIENDSPAGGNDSAGSGEVIQDTLF